MSWSNNKVTCRKCDKPTTHHTIYYEGKTKDGITPYVTVCDTCGNRESGVKVQVPKSKLN